MPRVVHFEIAADDPKRAAEFYKNVFNWTIEEWEGRDPEYWLVTTGLDNLPGINGGIFRRETPLSEGSDIRAYRCTIDVPNLDEYSEKITKNGGQVIQPKSAVMGIGWMAFFKDTEGNVFGIMQNDMSAK